MLYYKSNKGPIASLANNASAARIWMGVWVGTCLIFFIWHYTTIRALKDREWVTVVDPSGTMQVAPLLAFDEKSEMQEFHAEFAIMAGWDRLPNGNSRFPEMLDKLFLKQPLEELKRLIESEKKEIVEKMITQTTIPGKIDIIKTGTQEVVVTIEFKINRIGLVNNETIVEPTKDLKAKFTFRRNPKLRDNGRFPLAVWKFEWKDITREQ